MKPCIDKRKTTKRRGCKERRKKTKIPTRTTTGKNCLNKNIASLTVPELNKYISHHNLSKNANKMKKKDKVALVEAHIATTQLARMLRTHSAEETAGEIDDMEDEDDIVITEWGTTENAENEELDMFFLCRQPEDDRFLVCCDLCEEWFHGDCIDLSDEEVENLLAILNVNLFARSVLLFNFLPILFTVQSININNIEQ